MTSWIDAIASDPIAILFAAAVGLFFLALFGMLLAGLARRRRERPNKEMAPARADELAIAPWVQEGRQLFNLWQERVERLTELHSRLAAMAQEIERLKAQLGRMEQLQADNLRLNQEAEALLLERDHLRTALARIGELIQRATEARPGPAGAAAPDPAP